MSDSSTSIAERLQLNGINADMLATLRGHSSLVISALPAILDDFYSHMSRQPAAAAFFRDQAHMEHAKQKQLQHWRLIAEGRFDADYEASVLKIGKTHFRLGLEPIVYICGYSQLLSGLMAAVHSLLQPAWGKSDGRTALQTALVKVALLDMDIALSVYIDMERNERQKAMDALKLLGRTVGGVAESVSAAAIELEATARSMASSVGSTADEAKKVSGATDEVSGHVASVASATEELTGSVREIGAQVDKSVTITTTAMDNAGRSAEKMSKLAGAADKIGMW